MSKSIIPNLFHREQQRQSNKAAFDNNIARVNALGNEQAIRTMLGPNERQRLHTIVTKASQEELSYMAWLASQGRNGEVAAMEAEIAGR